MKRWHNVYRYRAGPRTGQLRLGNNSYKSHKLAAEDALRLETSAGLLTYVDTVSDDVALLITPLWEGP